MNLRLPFHVALAALSITVFHSSAFSHTVVVEDDVSQMHTFEISEDDSFEAVIGHITNYFEEHGIYPTPYVKMMVLPENYQMILNMAKKPRAAPRSFNAGVTPAEGGDISYILRTLSNSTLPKIKSSESSLKKAGDRIDQVHPLQFLIYVFTNEELKVAIRNLEGRSWVWSDFIKGITETLAEENGKGNIMPYLNDFSVIININIDIILPLAQAGRWEKFVTTLIATVPRAEGSGRYDQ